MLATVSGCIGQVASECRHCVVVDAHHLDGIEPQPPSQKLFVLVPGAVGYGAEWAPAVAALRAAHQPFVVYAWDPWGSLAHAAAGLHAVLTDALDDPGAPRELEVIGHSAGGMVAAYALAHLRVPPARRVHVVTIGTPFAGVSVMFCSSDDDFMHTPTLLAMGACFHRYPPVPERADLTEYITSGLSDPVMESHFGRDPADPRVGPWGARRVEVDPHLNHDQVVALVVRKLVSKN